MFDVVIRGGTVIDGTKKIRWRADVGLNADRITAVGDLGDASTECLIDAKNKIVAPGFIDVHNHSDGWLLKTSHLVAKTTQGFTTEVLMSDGISYAPVNAETALEWMFYLRSLNGLRMDEYDGWETIGDYMSRLDGRNVQNSVAQIAYANVRTLACGFGCRNVDDFQMRQIQAFIRQGMLDGAVGVSTGLDYCDECYASTDELVEACSVLKEFGGFYVTHVRYKKGLMPALREAVEIGRRAGCPVHISHLKAQSPSQTEEVLTYIDREARQEVEFSFDVYPYQPGSTMLSYLIPNEVWDDGPIAAMARLRHSGIRSRFRNGFSAYRLNLDQVRIAWVGSKENTCHQGKTLAEYIDGTGHSSEEALFNLLLEERMAVLCVMDEGDDRLVEPFLQHDLFMMGSDGIYFENSCVHPRVYGSAPRLLGPMVRDRKLFSLEDAVHKLSKRAADRFGLADRGQIDVGCFADLVIFDPDAVTDKATFANPHQVSIGIETVIVNGTLVISDGTPMDTTSQRLPGRFLKYEPGQ